MSPSFPRAFESTLSSRPKVQEILDSIKIKVSEDYTIDPPEMRLVREKEFPESDELLLVKPAASPITIYDLICVLDKLGFHVDYEELL